MGFERLNGEIKRPCHIMNNFRNPQVQIRFSLSIVEIKKILFLKIGIYNFTPNFFFYNLLDFAF